MGYCNTSGLLQHKWHTAPQVAYSIFSSGYLFYPDTSDPLQDPDPAPDRDPQHCHEDQTG